MHLFLPMASNTVMILLALAFLKLVFGGNLCYDLKLNGTLIDMKPTGYLSVKLQVTDSLAHCGSICAQTWSCASFFYKKTTRECRLYKAKLSALDLVNEGDWIGYAFEGKYIIIPFFSQIG